MELGKYLQGPAVRRTRPINDNRSYLSEYLNFTEYYPVTKLRESRDIEFSFADWFLFWRKYWGI